MNRKYFTWQNFFHSHLFFVVGLGVLVLLSVNLIRAQLKDQGIRGEIADLQAEVDAMDQEHVQYNELLKMFETPAFLETEARRSLGYVKPGEKVVVVEDNAECRMQNAECTGVEKKQDKSNPMKWWIYFFGDS